MGRLSGAGVARLVVLAAAVMAVPASAQTGPFQVVAQDRNASIQYRLDTFSNGGALQDVSVQIPDQPQHLEPGELTLRADTPGVVTIFSPDATASVDAHVLQHSTTGPSSLDFEMVAQGQVFGTSTPPGNYGAEARLGAFYSIQFDVATPTRISISFDRHVTLPGDFFHFSLIRQDFTAGICCTTEQLGLVSFTQLALLSPGRHLLSAVGGTNILSNTSGNPFPVSTLIFGSLHITALPIPEPPTAVLMLAGLGVAGVLGRRLRRLP